MGGAGTCLARGRRRSGLGAGVWGGAEAPGFTPRGSDGADEGGGAQDPCLSLSLCSMGEKERGGGEPVGGGIGLWERWHF